MWKVLGLQRRRTGDENHRPRQRPSRAGGSQGAYWPATSGGGGCGPAHLGKSGGGGLGKASDRSATAGGVTAPASAHLNTIELVDAASLVWAKKPSRSERQFLTDVNIKAAICIDKTGLAPTAGLFTRSQPGRGTLSWAREGFQFFPGDAVPGGLMLGRES